MNRTFCWLVLSVSATVFLVPSASNIFGGEMESVIKAPANADDLFNLLDCDRNHNLSVAELLEKPDIFSFDLHLVADYDVNRDDQLNLVEFLHLQNEKFERDGRQLIWEAIQPSSNRILAGALIFVGLALVCRKRLVTVLGF